MEEFKVLTAEERTQQRRDYRKAQAGKNLLKGIAAILGGTAAAVGLTLAKADPTTVSIPIVLGSTSGVALISSFFREKKIDEADRKMEEILKNK